METTESLRADWLLSYCRAIYQSKRDGKGFSEKPDFPLTLEKTLPELLLHRTE